MIVFCFVFFCYFCWCCCCCFCICICCCCLCNYTSFWQVPLVKFVYPNTAICVILTPLKKFLLRQWMGLRHLIFGALPEEGWHRPWAFSSMAQGAFGFSNRWTSNECGAYSSAKRTLYNWYVRSQNTLLLANMLLVLLSFLSFFSWSKEYARAIFIYRYSDPSNVKIHKKNAFLC